MLKKVTLTLFLGYLILLVNYDVARKHTDEENNVTPIFKYQPCNWYK